MAAVEEDLFAVFENSGSSKNKPKGADCEMIGAVKRSDRERNDKECKVSNDERFVGREGESLLNPPTAAKRQKLEDPELELEILFKVF